MTRRSLLALLLLLATMNRVACAGEREGSKPGDRKELAPGHAFRWCPAGMLTMGQGDKEVNVELTVGFWLGETEVSQVQWLNLMGTKPWQGRQRLKEGDDYAASLIRHDDAVAFCERLTTQERNAGRLPRGWKYSLPTEAQWEYACRAGTQTAYSFGDSKSKLSEYAWWGAGFPDGNAKNERYPHPVGKKKPNAWGLYDMHGNVWEWCSDWYSDKVPGGRDPVGPGSGSNRVIRGGSWTANAATCVSANRFYYNPGLGNLAQGFRIAIVPSGE